jgi:hypothetical protein
MNCHEMRSRRERIAGQSCTHTKGPEMTSKDRVIYATDRIADALQALCRVNYDNDKQAAYNISVALTALREATTTLEFKS